MKENENLTFFQIYRSNDKKKSKRLTRWRYFLEGELVAKSKEPFANYEAKYSIQRIRKNLKYGKYRWYTTIRSVGRWYWKLKSPNGRTVAMSTDFFKEEEDAKKAALAFKNTAWKASICKEINKE